MTWIVIGQTGGKQGTATEWVSCMLGEGGGEELPRPVH